MDPATRALINSSALIVLSAAFAFAASFFWHRKNKAEREAEKIAEEQSLLMTRVTDLESQLLLVKSNVLPITAAFQAILIKELTHYHTPRMDELMTRVGPPSTLSPDEEAELIQLLKQRTEDLNGRISDSEKEAADILPAVMRRARAEALEVDKTKLMTVAVVETDGTTDAESK